MLETQLRMGLRVWATTIEALAQRAQIFIPYKGELRYDGPRLVLPFTDFALLPTYENPGPDALLPGYEDRLDAAAKAPSDGLGCIGYAATVTDLANVTTSERLRALTSFMALTPEYIERHFHWHGQTPLSLLLLRVYTLPHAIAIAPQPHEADDLWVTLDTPIDTAGAEPVVPLGMFTRMSTEVHSVL